MFKLLKVDVPTRVFSCELKHRPEGGDSDSEELIDVLELEVPKLKNSDMEKQWAVAQIWNKICSDEFKNRGINQIFIFTAEFRELLMRMELNPFEDEPSRKLPPPDETAFKKWQQAVEKQFKKVYRISLEEWRNTLSSPTEGA